MSKIKWKGGALLAPMPAVMVTCDDGIHRDVLTIAWTGIVCSTPPKTYISLRPTRFSYNIIQNAGHFVINLVPRPLAYAADLCGMKSGRDVDKFELCSLLTSPSPELGCPMLDASPIGIECRLDRILPLGSHDMFLADIVSVSVEDTFIDASGKLRLDKADIIGFAHGSYYTLGSFLGNIGYSVAKKKPANRSKKR